MRAPGRTRLALSLIATLGLSVAVILGGVEEVIAPNHPECKRPFIKDADALEKFWWSDFEKLPSVKGQRVVYQCHALLSQRTAREAYAQMESISKAMAKSAMSQS